MRYHDILFAYDDIRRGVRTRADVLAMYREMPEPCAVFDRGDTLLHLAARFAHAEAAKYLLEQGTAPDCANEASQTPLWALAASRDIGALVPAGESFATATALIEAGAATRGKDANGNWSYLVAAQNGNGEFLAALHAAGVRITRADEDGNNGFHLLIESMYNPLNDDRLARKRLEEATERGRDSDVEVARRNAESCRAVLDSRLAAAFAGVKALLEAGLDPEDKNNMGETAHVLAERRGLKEIGALLKGEITGEEDSADPQAALRLAAGGMTLHQAVAKEDEAAIRALVELGADVNGVDDIYGYGQGAPLAMACRDCRWQTARLLLELGADPNGKTGDGRTAITWLTAPRMGPEAYKTFAENRPAKLLDALVQAGLDLNIAVNDSSDTLLTWALGDNQELEAFADRESLRWLLVKAAVGHGADVNKANARGQTPLMLAGAGSRMRMAADLQLLLLEKGADVAARDREGNTPLICVACNTDAAATREMAENLFDFGDPLPGAVNNAGKSALDCAAAQNNEMLVKLLLANL